MSNDNIRQFIQQGKASLGIEFGSTRIKAVLVGPDNMPIAVSSHEWENRLENGIWTYHLDEVWQGLQSAYKSLAQQVEQNFGTSLEQLGGLGISGMMHGYLVFNEKGEQLTEFRTWRNTITSEAAELLTAEFGFNIPQRWSIAHLYQAILNQESHVKDIAFITTLAGYVHWKLTGKKVMGIGEASGMFPIDSTISNYNKTMLASFDKLIGKQGFGWQIQDILPQVLSAGEDAGALSKEGAALLDPSGMLKEGISLCPPEGDAGTGMVATNSVAKRTGNVSAGTSIFAMIVLEKELSKVYPEIDMITTPSGKPVAMVHCNNCSSELDSWVNLFGEVAGLFGGDTNKANLYEKLYNKALEAPADAGGLLCYNYLSGEHITGFEEGRPLLAREQGSILTLASLMKANLYSAMATLKLGMDILTEQEQVKLERLLGHGGLFKTKGVAQSFMASALDVPVAVLESAGEGGAWGIALLAAYAKNKETGQTLEDFLSGSVFGNDGGETIAPNKADSEGFDAFIQRYKKGLAIERAAVDSI